MRTLLCLLTLGVVAAAACSSEAARRRDIERCSVASSNPESIALCLELQEGWDSAAAAVAGRERGRYLDSVRTAYEDSIWIADSTRRRAELRQCRDVAEVADCLLTRFGWDERRAVATADTLWQRDAAEHRREIADCQRRERGSNISGCLRLFHQWPVRRAMAVDDSIQRARAAAARRP